MKIRRLIVDTLGNVFISTNYLEEFDLERIVYDKDSMREHKSWISLGDKWYQKPR